MKLLLSGIVSALIILCIFFFTTVQLAVHALKNGRDDKVRTEVQAWFGLIKIETEVPIVRLADDLSGTEYRLEMKTPEQKIKETEFKLSHKEFETTLGRIKQLFHSVTDLHLILKGFLQTVRLVKLDWRTRLGTGDAAETGVLVGVGWSVKSVVLRLIQSYFTLRTIPKINVSPSYQVKCLEIDFRCMIRFRIGNAIIAGIRMLKNLQRRRDTRWQNTQFKA